MRSIDHVQIQVLFLVSDTSVEAHVFFLIVEEEKRAVVHSLMVVLSRVVCPVRGDCFKYVQ